MEKAFRITSIINIVLGGGLLVVAGLGYLLDSLKLIILIIAIFGTIFIISGIKGLQYKKNTIELSIGSDFICSLYCTLLFILMLDGTLILFLIFFIVHALIGIKLRKRISHMIVKDKLEDDKKFSKVMICLNCGNRDSTKFCVKCGAKMVEKTIDNAKDKKISLLTVIIENLKSNKKCLVLALVIFILMIVTVIWTFAVNSDGYYKSSESILYDENSKKLEAEFELIGKDELLDTLREYTGLEDLDFDYSLTSSVDVVHCEIKKFKSDKIDDYYTVEINDEKAEKLKDILEYLADMRDNEEHDDYDDYDFTFTGSAGTNIGIDIWGSYDSIETSSGRIYELRSGEVYINNKVVYENKNSAVSTETTPTKTAVPEVTMGEINALQSAKDYLEYSGFSYKGLIEQLEYEGYSNKEATYAADNCGADWKKEAIRVAQDYIDYTSFSKQGLIEQLKYEGFTSEQAAYGASGVGY